ncbi:hypothetical protein [Henriciella aquimarina]|uniref:hypothetical protein n=1 Tax=Henriciella aquimarina TaxID=545261 RepID=UPI00117A93A9|nr:hypothetical protein [Henriciella aquimarina]
MNDVFQVSELLDLAVEDHPQAAHFRIFKLAPGNRVGDDEKLCHDSVKPVGNIDGVKRTAFPSGLSREPAAVSRRSGFPAFAHERRSQKQETAQDTGRSGEGWPAQRISSLCGTVGSFDLLVCRNNFLCFSKLIF